MSLKNHRLLIAFATVFAFASSESSFVSLHAQSAPSGGFVDSATSNGLRPRLSAAEIQTFLPARGRFTFPSPYQTQGVRLTNGGDCGGADCVWPVGYSYWANINNHVGSDTMLIFLGLNRSRGGSGPTLFTYNKRTGETTNAGPLFSGESPFSWSTGEGWYFSGTQPTKLYLNDGPRMLRYDVLSHTFETVYDVSSQFGSDKYIWQMHSSRDDRVHSATLRQTGTWAMLGCVAYSQDTGRATFYAKKGDFDECQIDKSGRWLVIKDNVDGAYQEDNRIIDLQTGTERVLLDQNGAAGHSDLGFGYMVAEDNFNPRPGAARVWDFNLDVQGGEPVASVAGQGTLVYELASWSSGLGHVAHGNTASGVPISRQSACSSNAHRENLPRVNEIVCYRLDGSLDVLVVAPNMTDLNASGGGSDDYSKLPKGNLDVTGEYFIWTANAGTNRLDAYIVRVPTLGGGSSPAPPPTSPPPPATPTPSTGAQAVGWGVLVNVTANGNNLQKTGGCGGCADAGAVSQQQIGSGDGYMEFTASETNTLRFVGWGSSSASGSGSDIRFAFRLQGGTAEVRESGAYKAETSFASGDVLRITLEGGSVKYSKNGAVFYTSSGGGYPLFVRAALNDLDATVKNVIIKVGAATSAASQAAGATGSPGRKAPPSTEPRAKAVPRPQVGR